MGNFLCNLIAVVVFIVIGGMFLIGGLMIVGSMFFEQTAAQITAVIVAQHVLAFFVGVSLIALALTIVCWLND